MTIEEFVGLPFSKQIHLACLAYLFGINQKAFLNGKPSPMYFKVRAYLWKLPRQNIKNIWMMLDEENKVPLKDRAFFPLYTLDNTASIFVRERQEESELKKQEELTNRKEYEIDLSGFLSA